MSERTRLIPRLCVFVAPEELVTTVEVKHPETLGGQAGGRVSRGATIVKGSPSRYALEACETLQMGTLSYYRKQGDSLIWDLLEGVIAGDERVESRRDDPADLDVYERTDTELSVAHPLGRALGPATIERLDVRETSQSSFLLGDNCLIWCASIEPQTADGWSLWRNSLERHYDHTTIIGDPALFARVLAMMASSRRDLLGSRADLQHPETGHVEQCGNVAVYDGPVAYLDNPRDYILKAIDALELIIRCIFTKTTEHRDQREYRYAILAEKGLERDTVHLRVPYSIRQALNGGSNSIVRRPSLREIGPTMCMPSPRLLQCFAADPTQRSSDYSHGLPLNAHIRQRVQLSGTHHQSSTTHTIAVSNAATTDNEELEAIIRSGPRLSDDARIARITIDGGPGTVTHLYCMEGIWGKISYRAVSGRASLKIPRSERDGTVLLHADNTGFDGLFSLSHSAQQLILTVVTMNPAATVDIHQPCRNPELPDNHIRLIPDEDTHVTVTATSADQTQTSSFEIIVDRALCPTRTPTSRSPAR